MALSEYLTRDFIDKIVFLGVPILLGCGFLAFCLTEELDRRRREKENRLRLEIDEAILAALLAERERLAFMKHFLKNTLHDIRSMRDKGNGEWVNVPGCDPNNQLQIRKVHGQSSKTSRNSPEGKS